MEQIRGNNKGLSLLEVLIAVVILTIVAAPFLHSFVTTAHTNSKAREVHKATVLAQSVMEGFKTKTVEDIAKQFDYPARGFGIVDPERIGNGTGAVSHVRELRFDSIAGSYMETWNYEHPALAGVVDKRGSVTASTYSEDMGEHCEFLGQSDGKYYFAMDSVKEDSGLYDVLVKLDASVYRTGPDPASLFNAQDLAQLPVIDRDRDAVCIQKQDYTQNAVAEFCIAHQEMSEADIRAAMRRTITIGIEKTRTGSGEDRVRVLTEYRYTYQKTPSDPEQEYVKTLTGFDSTETGGDLRSVYLCYFPLYSTGVERDEIILQNESGVPVNFYVLKQESSETTVASENGYHMKLSFSEAPGTVASTMATKLYTNLNRNIASGATGSYTGFCNVFLNGSSVALNEVAVDDMLSYSASDRVFDISVSIYRKGAATAGYPEDSKIATLLGSRLD